MKNFISDNTGILIRIDDIAENMNWDLMENVKYYLINIILNLF